MSGVSPSLVPGSLSRDDLIGLRDKLVRARASGLRRVRTGEDEIEYRSDAEMVAAIADLDRQIAAFEPRRHWLGNAIVITMNKGI